MARLALKPDSSFFRKIAIGAIGTRTVCAELATRGHHIVELERGSLDTKLWKDVKRKRVRIPDLVCERCGLRVESRAKTKPELSMSHSLSDEARAWDFGMIETDCIAFPVCQAIDEKQWAVGKLGAESSYWHEKNRVRWKAEEGVNYFRVATFRSTTHARTMTKGVTEGSETIIAWKAIFSSRTGTVESVDGESITIRRDLDGHRYRSKVPSGVPILVVAGQQVRKNEVIASALTPVSTADLLCPEQLPEGHILHLLSSRERTQRFTGVKLARLRRDDTCRAQVADLAADKEEDVYIRLEGMSYLASVCGQSVPELFSEFLGSADEQTQLEAVIALGETANAGAVELLCEILDSSRQPYFVRSAAAWCLGRIRSEEAVSRLVRAFADVDRTIRDEALGGLVSVGRAAIPILLEGIREVNQDIAAGCAEALRQQKSIPDEVVTALGNDIKRDERFRWSVWLLGHLPRDRVANAIAGLQDESPHLQYAISLLWSFVESWIARRWELYPGSDFSAKE